jgi:hypothetical protein
MNNDGFPAIELHAQMIFGRKEKLEGCELDNINLCRIHPDIDSKSQVPVATTTT